LVAALHREGAGHDDDGWLGHLCEFLGFDVVVMAWSSLVISKVLLGSSCGRSGDLVRYCSDEQLLRRGVVKVSCC
jgi:hypothetical protein